MGSTMRGALVLLGLWLGASSPGQATETVVYYHTDALGSPVAVTDAGGAVIERRTYEPYGKQLAPALQDGPNFTGHVADVATGLVYMQQRYYDPLCGCFLSTDPVTALKGPFNRYWYANNNPYKFLDPDGRANKLGVEVKTQNCAGSDSRCTQGTELTQRGVDLTVEGALASGDAEAIHNASVWEITYDPTADKAPQKGGSMETQTGTDSITKEVIFVKTFVSNQILGAGKSEQNASFRHSGMKTSFGDPAVGGLLGHELGHSFLDNRSMLSGRDKELNASQHAIDLLEGAPGIPSGSMQLCPTCF